MTTKVLSINGSLPMNYVVKNVLSKNWDVIAAGTVAEGINFLKKLPDIEVIIADIDRHTKETLNFISYIKSSWMYHKPILVLSSTEVLPPDLEYDLSETCLLKPFNPTELLDRVKLLASKSVFSTTL